MIGAVKDYKKYCNYYKYIATIFLVLSILFMLLLVFFIFNANLNLSIQSGMYVILYLSMYFQSRLMLSICLD